MKRKRFTLKFRAEFYALKQDCNARDVSPEQAAQKGWEDGYRARQRDEAATRKKAKAP